MPVQIREGVEAYPVDIATLEKLERTHNRVSREHIRNSPRRGDDYNEPQILKGKLDGDLTNNSFATVSLWEPNASGVEADTGTNISPVYDPIGKRLIAGTKVTIANIGPRWYVIEGPTHLDGILDEDLVFNGDADMSVYENGSDTGSTQNVETWLLESGKKLSTGFHVVAAWMNGKWRVINSRECSVTA